MSDTSKSRQENTVAQVLGCVSVLVLILLFHFSPSIKPDEVVFSNDGPLGVANSDSLMLPSSYQGFWMDLYWIGANGAHAPASFTSLIRWLTGPVGYSKFYAPLTILFSGIGAWAFFRTLGLGAALSIVAAIGAAFNSNFFSNTLWGLGTRSLTLGCVFFALAALSSRRVGNFWLNASLAGMAVGMAVIEGADNGVIFSLFVAAFVAWQSWMARKESASEPGGGGLSRGFVRLVLVAGFAGFIATQSLISLFDIASKGAAAASATATEESKEFNWMFASQWSLPPRETMRVLVPGSHGYRMDTTDGGNYWGRVGESPGNPGSRFSGAGEYAGILVVLLSLWTLGHLFQRNGGPFTKHERQMVGFWGVVMIVGVVLAWGKYTPLYRLTVYQLPYFSSIRNPMKFMHVAHMALMILSAYGLLGLSRRYFEAPKRAPAPADLRNKADDQRWKWIFIGCVAASAVWFMAWASNKPGLIKYLESAGFDGKQAEQIAPFSVGEMGKFVLFTALSAGALLLVIKRVFAGPKAILGSIVLGLVLTVDLARANAPWVVYWNYPYKYASNPILEILRDKPHEARVVAPQPLMNPQALQGAGGYSYLFAQLYTIEWVQHHFQYYNIQSIDVSQEPRPPADKKAYLGALYTSWRSLGRYWQLTNTRYILGIAQAFGVLNQEVDSQGRFRIRSTFDVIAKPGVTPSQMQDFTAVPKTNGPLALFEFTGALPRAKLYARWQVITNGDETLKTLADPAFDPVSSVIISDDIPPSSSVVASPEGGPVEFVRYSPRRIELKANPTVASMLLLNDRFDKDWHVTVDGQPAQMLRANFIMRGVQVPAGPHTILFEFRPSLTGLKISLAAIVVAVGFCGLLLFVRPADRPANVNLSATGRESSPKPKSN